MKQPDIVAQLATHDNQIAAIQKLIQTGMRMIIRNDQQIARNAQAIERNTQAIAELTKNVNALVKYGERGQNGHRKNGPKIH